MSEVFKREWIKMQMETFTSIYPELPDKELKKYLSKVFDETVNNREVTIDNNYVNKSIKTTILDTIDWIDQTKPIISGHGVFFRNQNVVKNPAAVMLQKFLNLRKELKDKMKTFQEGTYEYETYDRLQLTEKINANSYYGVGGNKHSYFYNVYTATSITSTGQSLISTTENAFEMFLANNILFYNMDDCFNFLNCCIRDCGKLQNKIKYGEASKFELLKLPRISRLSLIKRIISTFLTKNYDETILSRYINNLTDYQASYIYFKNNVYTFTMIPEINELLTDIYLNVDEFKDPTKIPKSIKGDLKDLWEYYKVFVFHNHFSFARIDRLKFHKRKTVVTVDTDSNMINLDPWVRFTEKQIISKYEELYTRDSDNIRFISVNIMCFMMTEMIGEVLWKYTKGSNVVKEYRPKINMKNEFLFSRLILAPKKKRYISTVRLREGKEIYPEKIDIKGHDFAKSSTREATKNYFVNLVKNKLLNGDIDVADIVNDLEKFENKIRKSLMEGEKDFLIPKSVKELGAYAEPYREQGVRAVVAWNSADKDNPISLPVKLDIVKVKMHSKESIASLEETHPVIYKRLIKEIYDGPIEKLRKKGILAIAIPRNLDRVPEWIMPFIDYDGIINDNISRSHSVLRSLGIALIKTKTGEHFSNILHI